MRDEDFETTHLTIRILKSVFKKKNTHTHREERMKLKFFLIKIGEPQFYLFQKKL